MSRPEYLNFYKLDWELLDVVISGKSALDSQSFLHPMDTEGQVEEFLKNYGFDPSNLVYKAELFGYFQEAIQFIKRYFLKEGNSDGIDLSIPNKFFTITDIRDLFYIITSKDGSWDYEEKLWAGVILKIMHTILHADKDLRSNYFDVIQQQIFDRFYKYMSRQEEKLFLGTKKTGYQIPLLDFQTKSKKSRDSVIIKMLHKVENVAEELFDRVGVRFVTYRKFDTLRVIKFLQEQTVILAQNIKPSRSMNTIIDLKSFRPEYGKILKDCIKNNWSEDEFLQAIDAKIQDYLFSSDGKGANKHSSNSYRSIQFTSRQLIIFRNPVINQLSKLKRLAKVEKTLLAKEVSKIDLSMISRDVRFFYPFEVQVMDKESYEINTQGEASHEEYKKSQQNAALKRVFKDLLDFKKINY